MNLIVGKVHRELAEHTEKAQVNLYLGQYLSFWREHFGDLEHRDVDRALWAFGKFMNEKRKTPFSLGTWLAH